MKVIYAPRALRDIDEILAYINERSPTGARNVSLAIEHTVHMCALNPRAGARTMRQMSIGVRWDGIATHFSTVCAWTRLRSSASFTPRV